MNRSFLALVAPFLFFAAGCSVETNEPEAPSPSSSSSTNDTTPAPEYKVSCDGTVSALSPSTLSGSSLQIRCVGGPPGTRCGEEPASDGDSGSEPAEDCGADDVAIRYEGPPALCVSTTVYHWDGTQCVGSETITNDGEARCAGADCPKLSDSLEACEAAHVQCGTKR